MDYKVNVIGNLVTIMHSLGVIAGFKNNDRGSEIKILQGDDKARTALIILVNLYEQCIEDNVDSIVSDLLASDDFEFNEQPFRDYCEIIKQTRDDMAEKGLICQDGCDCEDTHYKERLNAAKEKRDKLVRIAKGLMGNKDLMDIFSDDEEFMKRLKDAKEVIDRMEKEDYDS